MLFRLFVEYILIFIFKKKIEYKKLEHPSKKKKTRVKETFHIHEYFTEPS